jgi:hypothetical protein
MSSTEEIITRDRQVAAADLRRLDRLLATLEAQEQADRVAQAELIRRILGGEFEAMGPMEGLLARAAVRAILRTACAEARARALQRLEALQRVPHEPPLTAASADVHYQDLERGSFVRAVVNQLGKPMRRADVDRIEQDANRRLDPIVQAYLGGSATLERTEFALKEAVSGLMSSGAIPNRPRCVFEKDAYGPRSRAVWYAERVPPSTPVAIVSAAR